MELKCEHHEAFSEMFISSENNERRGGENNAESRLFFWPQYLYSHLMGELGADKQIDCVNVFLCSYQEEIALSASVNNTYISERKVVDFLTDIF